MVQIETNLFVSAIVIEVMLKQPTSFSLVIPGFV